MEKNSAFDKGSLLSALMKSPVKGRFEALEKGEIAAEDFDPIFTQVFNKEYGRKEEVIPMFSSITKVLYNMKIVPEMVALLKASYRSRIKCQY
ncbi:unnamed protein product [Strongylus vulgaris]|uniref:Uncharacterized protein n=1 Tax=Strongylus vulgaris TaxID=40348 RepID=A0A3P7JRD0_STRVU|nr:unnamed protein product [Strongylus vulgaris]